MTAANSVNPSPGFIRFGLYPASWMAVLAANHLVVNELAGPRLVWGSVIGILAVTYLAVEFAWPYERRWSMTWRSLLDDLRYAAVNTAFVAGLRARRRLLEAEYFREASLLEAVLAGTLGFCIAAIFLHQAWPDYLWMSLGFIAGSWLLAERVRIDRQEATS